MYKLAESLAQKIELGFEKQPTMEELKTALRDIILNISNVKDLFEEVSRQDLLSPYDLEFKILKESYEKVFRLQQLLTEENRDVYSAILGKYGREFVKYSKGIHKYRTKWNYEIGNENIDFMLGSGLLAFTIDVALLLIFGVFTLGTITFSGVPLGAFIKRRGYEQNQKRFEFILKSLTAL